MVDFSEDVTAEICERVAQGESVRSICKDARMPAMSTVFKWLDQDATFAEQYARAKEVQADNLFEEVLEIADSAKPDDVAVAKLKIDARKWMAGKLRPKKYGDKVEVDHQSSDGSMTPVVGFDVRIAHAPSSNTDETAG